VTFEWDPKKNISNVEKHGVSFENAKLAFLDPLRIITEDLIHSTDKEKRLFCFGKTDLGTITVRFTVRNQIIRIFGAGIWRQGKIKYEEENSIQ
jgi:hypothetical protein